MATFDGYFYIYEKETKKTYFGFPLSSHDGLKCVLQDEKPYYLGGNEYYINCLEELFSNYKPIEHEAKDVEVKLKEELEAIIKVLDNVPYNNPCGLPIKTIILKD